MSMGQIVRVPGIVQTRPHLWDNCWIELFKAFLSECWQGKQVALKLIKFSQTGLWESLVKIGSSRAQTEKHSLAPQLAMSLRGWIITPDSNDIKNSNCHKKRRNFMVKWWWMFTKDGISLVKWWMYVSVKKCPLHTRVNWAPTLALFDLRSGWYQFVLVPCIWDSGIDHTVSVQYQNSINQVCQVEISASPIEARLATPGLNGENGTGQRTKSGHGILGGDMRKIGIHSWSEVGIQY